MSPNARANTALKCYALLGPWDYLNIVDALYNEAAMRLAMLVRSRGHGITEVWPAVECPRFKRLLQGLPLRT